VIEMKNRKMIVTTGLCLVLSACTVFAQQPAMSAVDQEIEKLEKRLAELKQRKREILQKQIAALEEELKLNGVTRLRQMEPGELTSNARQRADATANATNAGGKPNGADAGEQSFAASGTSSRETSGISRSNAVLSPSAHVFSSRVISTMSATGVISIVA
jgi:hypothetical protein